MRASHSFVSRRGPRTAFPPQSKVTRISEALERLAKLYEAKGDEPEAAAWRSTLDAAKTEQADAPGTR